MADFFQLLILVHSSPLAALLIVLGDPPLWIISLGSSVFWLLVAFG